MVTPEFMLSISGLLNTTLIFFLSARVRKLEARKESDPRIMGNWISVNDGLPKDDIPEYWINCGGGCVQQAWFDIYEQRFYKLNNGHSYFDEGVVLHYQKLVRPEPPGVAK